MDTRLWNGYKIMKGDDETKFILFIYLNFHLALIWCALQKIY